MTRRAVILFWQLLILASLLVVWQWGFEWSKALLPKAYVPKILDPYFIAKPSAIWQSFLKLGCLRPGDGFVACLGVDDNNLWLATLVTLKNTWWGFLFGSASGIAAGLILGRSDLLARIFELDSSHRRSASDHPDVRARRHVENCDSLDRRVFRGVLQYLRGHASGRP
jgi:ABC-type nitrate/sulfonate/bicarbonate transport system permease component